MDKNTLAIAAILSGALMYSDVLNIGKETSEMDIKIRRMMSILFIGVGGFVLLKSIQKQQS